MSSIRRLSRLLLRNDLIMEIIITKGLYIYISPVTGLARLPGRILWCVHMGNFIWVDRDEFRKHNQNGGTLTYIVRDCHSLVANCNFANTVNSHTPKVEIHTRSKFCLFGRYVAKAKLFLFEKCRPGYRAGAFIWKGFHLGISVAKTDISITGPARPFI